eukprot:COSAG03_NODE_401_length_8203_cov_1.979393_5_plen_187_part_00
MLQAVWKTPQAVWKTGLPHTFWTTFYSYHILLPIGRISQPQHAGHHWITLSMTTATLSGGLPVLSSGAAAPLTGRNRARAYIICIVVQRRNRRADACADGGLQVQLRSEFSLTRLHLQRAVGGTVDRASSLISSSGALQRTDGRLLTRGGRPPPLSLLLLLLRAPQARTEHKQASGGGPWCGGFVA